MKEKFYFSKAVLWKYKSQKGFTLIELIVVITIITIMASMSFLSYSDYAKTARDSSRQDSILMISKALEQYANLKWSYPIPDNYTAITYSWNTLWKQWIVWDWVSLALRISSKPKDPLYDAEYSYSVTSNSTQYELSSVLENTPKLSYNSIFNTTYASEEYIWYAFLIWTYNKLFVKTDSATWNTLFVASPSITLSDLSVAEITDTSFNTWSFVIDKKSNIPDSYKKTLFKRSWDFYFTPKLVWEINWVITSTWFQDIISNTRSAYTWTIFQNPINVWWNTIWQSILFSTPWSEEETKIWWAALDGLTNGSFSFAWNTPSSCSGTTYSWSLFNSYTITALNHLESRIFTQYENITDSSWNVIWTNNYSIQAICNNWVLTYKNETKTTYCNETETTCSP